MDPLTRPRWRSDRGAELIELAIALPLLLLAMMGIIDCGFMFQRYLVLTNAAMEGARVATLPGYTAGDVQSRATAFATAGGVPGTVTVAVASVSLPGAGGSTWPGTEVTVTHPYQYRYIGPFAALFGGSITQVTLTTRATVGSQLGS